MTATARAVRLRDSQVDASGFVLARAFADDPFFRDILPDDAERERVRPAFMIACTPYGQFFGLRTRR